MSSTHFTVNQTPSSHPVAVYQLIATMIAAGWTMVRSSDGTTFGAGVHVTSSGTGAGGWNNSASWVCLQQPSGNSAPYAGNRQLIFQNQSQNGNGWRICYSISGAYSGGNATQTPTAADEVVIFGGGTAAAPQYYGWINASATTYRCEAMADDGSAGTKFPFAFYMVCFANGGASGAVGGMYMDAVTNYETGDTDPFVFFGGVANSAALTLAGDLGLFGGGTITDGSKVGTGMGFGHCWVNAAAVNSLPANWAGVSALCHADSSASTVESLGTSPVTGNDIGVPIMYGRLAGRGGATGYKGISMMLRWKAMARAQGSTISIASPGAKEWITMGNLMWPWNGSVVSV